MVCKTGKREEGPRRSMDGASERARTQHVRFNSNSTLAGPGNKPDRPEREREIERPQRGRVVLLWMDVWPHTALTGSRVQGIDDDDAQCVGDAKKRLGC